MEQTIISAKDDYIEFDRWIETVGAKKILLVCDDAILYMKDFGAHLEVLEQKGIVFVRFRDFRPNPLYENVRDGVRVYREENCDSIIAVGGGSAMDVAKCIKLYAYLLGDGGNGCWLNAEYADNDIPFLAMPTTAGTGSEATRYAVVYYNGVKQSVTAESFIPGTVLMDPNALKTLPEYQRKATMCDALCHAVESFWSVNSTDESKRYSKAAISGVLKNMDGYLANTEEGNAGMLQAAYTAGKAINITQTTAGHAMCYKLTSLFGIAHGHAAVLCVNALLPYMTAHFDDCIDIRGKAYLESVFSEIAKTMQCSTMKDLCDRFSGIIENLGLTAPKASEADYAALKNSVNPDRLKNHPIKLTDENIEELYKKIC